MTDVVSEEDKKALEANAGKYSKFYAEFGAVLKEGMGEDFSNNDRLAKLLRFASSTTDSVSVGFADYKARMKEGQEAIYYITADTLAAARNSPQLEVFKKKGIEVLLMTDRVDEWALNYVHEFDGTQLQSVAKGAVDLGKLQDEAEKKAAEEAAKAFKPLLNAEHALVKKLDGSVNFNDLAHILFDQALLAEGGLPDDPAAYVRRVNALLV